ncbi:MAG: hypothetical protein JNL74_14270 [Fibrobacteres bacterium]|nr:hypothetical protein [Fibrobacterota bacterium]
MKLFSLCLLLLACAAGVEAARFTSEPVVTDEGSRFVIRFTVSELTDVAIYAEDTATGKIIAHIAGGVLGAKAPAPLQAGSLAQTLTWDKRDDRGNLLSGGYDIRVGLGLQARLDRFFGWQSKYVLNYNCISRILGMTVDSQGNIIVQAISQTKEHMRIYSFNRNGDYVRTLHPYSGALPNEKVRGFGRVTRRDGKIIPAQYQTQLFSVVPELVSNNKHGLSVSAQGWLLIPNGGPMHYGLNSKAARVIVMGLDGSCPRDTAYGPRLPMNTTPSYDSKTDLYPYIGLNPTADGKTLLACVDTVIYKSALDFSGTMVPFLRGFSKIRGLALDGAGRLYVADYSANLIRIFDSTGIKLDSISLTRPFEVKVHRGTGALYVASADSLGRRLILRKFSAFPAFDSVSQFVQTGDQYTFNRGALPNLALDISAIRPRIWIGPCTYGVPLITAVDDTGSGFKLPGVTIGGRHWVNTDQMPSDPGDGGVHAPGYITVDPDEKVCYSGNVNYGRIDLTTGTVTKSKIRSNELAFSLDGTLLYAFGNGNTLDSSLRAFDRSELQKSWPNGKQQLYVPENCFSGPYAGSRGLCVDKDNNLFVLSKTANELYAKAYRFSKEGERSAEPVFTMFDNVRAAVGGFQVDRSGSIFTTCNIRPRGITYPAGLTGPLFPNPEVTHQLWDFAEYNHYAFNMGCVFKFADSGGSIMRNLSKSWSTVPTSNFSGDTVPALQVDGFYRAAFEVSKATWQYFGVSPVPSGVASNSKECQCHMPRLAVDGFGMVFAPDADMNCVVALDNNGNEIMRFGDYGNVDDLGGGSSIPLAWPRYVVRVNKSVYISDVVNNRLVKVALRHKTLWSLHEGLDTMWTSGELASRALPGQISLFAFPQPFTPGVNLALLWPGKNSVVVTVHGADGRLVKTLARNLCVTDRLTLRWNGDDDLGRPLSAGCYLVRVSSGGKRISKILLLAR